MDALTLDVVCNLHGDVGVVQRLSEPADVDVSARAALRVAMRVGLALRVALDVTRLSTLSFLTSWSWRPWWSDDGATNIIT